MSKLGWSETLARESSLEAVLGLYKKGVSKGLETPWKAFNELFTLSKGQLNVITGVPSHGKSEFMDSIMINSILMHGWNWGVYSPENYPIELHWEKLIRKCTGMPFFGLNRMTEKTLIEAHERIDPHLRLIPPSEEDLTLDIIFDWIDCKSEYLDSFLIDPWNELDAYRPAGISETDYIGQCLTRMRRFARAKNIALFVVAHPRKMSKIDGVYEVPTAYDIAGSAHWYNKADNILCVYRDFAAKKVIVYVQKVKFKYFGKIGDVVFDYQIGSGNYLEAPENAFE